MPIPSTFANPDRLIVGCGYLGSRVAQLPWPGRTFALTRSREAELRTLGAIPVVGDIMQAESLRHLPQVGTVIYAVGHDRAAGFSMRQVYVQGLGNVLGAMAGAPRFVYVSSTSVYGQTNGEWVDENAITEPADESGRIVLEAEATLRFRRPDAVVLRFAGIYGPGRLLRRADSLRRGESIAADPDRWLNLIHVDDGVAAVMAAVERASEGATYNVADGQPPTRREFYTELARLLGAPPPTFALAAEPTNRRVSNARMRAELGVSLRFPSYREGLPAAVGG